jgi:hypothetical protein
MDLFCPSENHQMKGQGKLEDFHMRTRQRYDLLYALWT